MSINSLVAYWKEFLRETKGPPYIHPKDNEHLTRYFRRRLDVMEPLNFDKFVQGSQFGTTNDESRFQFSLLPVPYVGDLGRADVFILMLNPGFETVDYWGEYESRAFRQALERNLKQHRRGTEFPFLGLDPRFCWHSGYVYWEGKLRGIIRALAAEKNLRYRDALKVVSKRIACVELVPYHSAHFGGGALAKRLPSAQIAQQWVENALVPRARRGEVLIVATRKIKEWGIKKLSGRIVCYEGWQTRGAHLTPNSLGGRAILNRLL